MVSTFLIIEFFIYHQLSHIRSEYFPTYRLSSDDPQPQLLQSQVILFITNLHLHPISIAYTIIAIQHVITRKGPALAKKPDITSAKPMEVRTHA